MVLNPVDTSAFRKIFSHDDSLESGWYYVLGGIQDWPNAVVGPGEFLAGERHYIAFVSTAPNAVDIYFQGTLLGSTATTFTAPPAQAFFFRDDRGGSEQLDAVIDGLLISGTNRTPGEIAAVQQRLVDQAPTTPLAAAGQMTAPDLGTPVPTGTVIVHIVVTADSTVDLTNTASVVANETDTNPGNNLSTENTRVNPAADLSVAKVDDPDPVLVGENITYTIIVTNNGPSDATGVILTDTLPQGVSFVSAPAGCTELGGIVSCDLGTLLTGGSTAVEIVVTADTPGVLINSASLNANETDPDPTDNTAEETTFATTRTDINRDGRVDGHDLLILAANLGTSNEIGDVNRDGLVDVQDLVAVAADFGRVYV